jgi:ribosomal-protein-alanine N-acetyltransferase
MTSAPLVTLAANTVIRPLAVGDLDAVLDIERQSYSHPWSEAVFRDCFRSEYRLWALEQDGAIIGYAIVAYLVDEAHLLNLCVAPSHRQQGGAKRLLQQVLIGSREDGMRQALLEVRESNVPARQLSRREGFSTIGRRPDYYPDAGRREAAEVMSLSLTTS